jgi:hypothetical protein
VEELPLTVAAKTKLLFGPYRPPKLHKGDRTFCFLRGCDVVITYWSEAPISWPRCRAIGSRGGSGLLLDEELARAVRHESAAAIMHHWGVTAAVVWRWRPALGVSRWGTEGSRRLHQQLSEAGADVVKQREITEAERQRQRRTNKRLNLAWHLKTGYHGPLWTAAEVSLLDGRQDTGDVAPELKDIKSPAVRCCRPGDPAARRRGLAWPEGGS